MMIWRKLLLVMLTQIVDVEACHSMGKSNGGKLKKIIKDIVNCNICKKALLNRKELGISSK